MDRARRTCARRLRRIHSHWHPHRARRQGAPQDRAARTYRDVLHRREGPLSLHRRWGDAGDRCESGPGTLVIAPERVPAGILCVVIVRNRTTGEGFRYTVADGWLPKVMEWNQTLDPAGRFDAAMKAQGLFE